MAKKSKKAGPKALSSFVGEIPPATITAQQVQREPYAESGTKYTGYAYSRAKNGVLVPQERFSQAGFINGGGSTNLNFNGAGVLALYITEIIIDVDGTGNIGALPADYSGYIRTDTENLAAFDMMISHTCTIKAEVPLKCTGQLNIEHNNIGSATFTYTIIGFVEQI